MQKLHVARGAVLDGSAGAGIEGCRVEAWDASGRVPDMILYARTDVDGAFLMDMREDDKRAIFGDRIVTLYFRVLEAGTNNILVERGGELWVLDGRETKVTLRVAAPRGTGLADAVVRGTVSDVTGGIAGVYVKAYDENLGTRTPLGSSDVTDARGRYQIKYAPTAVPNGKQQADLVVEAYSDTRLTDLIAKSERRCRAPSLCIVNLVKSGDRWEGPSAYTTIVAAVSRVLGTLTLADLTEAQREQIACSTRLPAADVDALVAAAALARDYPPLSREVAFGLVQREFPGSADRFFLHSKAVVRRQLRAALDENLIPWSLDVNFEAHLGQWADAAAAWALTPRPTGTCGLYEVLIAAGIGDSGLRETFATAYCSNEQRIEDFWAGSAGGLSSSEKADVQLALQWWSLTRGYKPLIDYLAANKATYPTLEHLCALTEGGWLGILDTGGVGAPSTIPGATGTKNANYARVLATTLSTAFRMEALVARVSTGEHQQIKSFFTSHPTFAFGKERLSQTTLDALPPQTMSPENKQRLKGMERLFRIVPRYEPIKVLLDEGYTSAYAIQQKGKSRFLSEMSIALGGSSAAEDIYQKACWAAGASSALYAKYGGPTNTLQLNVLPDWLTGSSESQVADWASLFGTAGGCACKHCASVLGPAAYLADLLHWLDRFPSKKAKTGSAGTWSALDVLVGKSETEDSIVGRRPDLKLLELTCKSAHTPLPYIDLANEVMEIAIANPTLTATIKTSYDEDDLLAGPEIIHEAAHIAAWAAVNGAKHPFTLPVDLWAEEANTYLGFLGVKREEIINALYEGDSYENELTKSRLGVKALGFNLIADVNAASATDAWGGASASALKSVPVFLKQSGLTFAELEELLATRYVNGTGSGAASLAALELSGEDDCDVGAMELPALTASHLLRIHRFLRLRHRTGLRIAELDRLLAAFSSSATTIAIDALMLQKVTRAIALAARLSLPVSDVATFYAPLDHHEKYRAESPFRRVFLNRKAESPDLQMWSDLLTNEEDDAIPNTTLDAHRTSILQALGISSHDFDLLTDEAILAEKLSLPAAAIVAQKGGGLTRDAVSRLYSTVRLARALKLSIADFLMVLAHTSLVPLGAEATPAQTDAFCDQVADLRLQKLSVPEIQYVLWGFARPESGLAPPEEAFGALESGLMTVVDDIISLTETMDDTTGTRTEALLNELVAPVTPLSNNFVADILSTLNPEVLADILPDSLMHIERYMEEPLATVKAKLAGDPTDPGDGDPPAAPPQIVSSAERFAYVAKQLERHVRAEGAIVEALAARYALPPSSMRYLLVDALKAPGAAARPAIDDFLPARRGDTGATAERRKKTLRLIDRHARLLRGLRVGEPIPPGPNGAPPANPGELLWVYPDLAALPEEPPGAGDFPIEDAETRFNALLAVARHTALRDRLRGGPHALRRIKTEVATKPTVEGARAFLSEQTGWDRAAIDDLAEHFGYATSAAPGELAELADIDNLLRLERAVKLVARLGVASADARALLELDAAAPTSLQTPNDPVNARDLVVIARRAAKAKLSSAEWAKVARGLRDSFRAKLRDALLSHLVPRVYKDAGEAFGALLIDPEMSPCQLTSRVVMATNSVQVFVQRSFLDLDDEVKLPAEAGKEWEWRHAYRLWEANRKVFLYPENWIEPELRDDKTPLFKELEAKLAQGELTDAAAERALEGYLNGLAQVSRLEVMAVGYDEETGTDHVVARTRSKPSKWFYRKREKGIAWSAWEEMHLDIDSEGLLLMVAHRRLYLFWPMLMERPNEGQMPGQPDEMKPVAKRFDIRIGWSTFVNGGWTPKRLSDGALLTLEPAKGEEEPLGITADFIALVPSPIAAPDGLVAIGVTVSQMWRWSMPQNQAKVEAQKHKLVGYYTFDPCAGGRWSATKTHPNADVLSGPDTKDYNPNVASVGKLFARGISEQTPGGELVVPRHLPDEPSVTLLPIFGDHPGIYRVVTPSRASDPYFPFDRFAVEDGKRTFFARIQRTEHTTWTEASKAVPGDMPLVFPLKDKSARGIDSAASWAESQIMMVPHTEITEACLLELFDHPWLCEFARRLAVGGVSGLLGWKEDASASAQFLAKEIDDEYDPLGDIAEMPREEVDLTFGGAYSVYNWELFFHVPFLIAERLHQEGRYAEARRWFHFIFDPTGGPDVAGPKRYWRFRRFYENENIATIQEDLENLALTNSTAAEVQALVNASPDIQKVAEELTAQIATMQEKPFNPHALARHRVLAYQKNVVMRYIDNLLDWGDALFRRDTIEAMHEALQLYLMAADLLGPRPLVLEHKEEPAGETFAGLVELGLDALSNAAVDIEPIVPVYPGPGFECKEDQAHLPDMRLYFCVPPNADLVGYWDRVADRLFKLRNCMNIDGVVRQLPLFAPPIDPALLVKAAAAGVSLDKVLDALAAPAPLYRFVRLHAKAVELAAAVQGLGQSLLAAMEKRDGEDLTRLRQTHELAVLDAEREVRKSALKEAQETLAGLQRQRDVVAARETYYRTVPRRIAKEKKAQEKAESSRDFLEAAGNTDAAGAIVNLIPQLSVGFTGLSPKEAFLAGGATAATTLSAVARGLRDAAEYKSGEASELATEASYERRMQEWDHQAGVAALELRQLDKQIVAQEIRVAIAELELSNLDLRASQSREVDDFLRTKFTNAELYRWMVDELAVQHHQAYQMAHEMAKKAERAYQLERGEATKSFVRFGAWDSLKKGLLAGERLLQDLRALDAAYLSRADRERELVKHVSLAQLARDPALESPPYLVELRDTGAATEIEVPEALFDADYPGHYFRRLKAVSLTVSTVKPSHDSVQCELTLTRSAIRTTGLVPETGYKANPYADSEERFLVSTHAVKALSTSAGDDDAGMFQLDLRDEKLLPFEGSGVISTWTIEVPRETNRFPLHKISDVVLHLRYTSRDGGQALRTAVLEQTDTLEGPPSLPVYSNRLKRRVRIFSARGDFQVQWAKFVQGNAGQTQHVLELPIGLRHFWSFFGESRVTIVSIEVSATFAEKYRPPAGSANNYKVFLAIDPPGVAGEPPTPIASFTREIAFRKGEPLAVRLPEDPVLDIPVLRENEEGFAPWTISVSRDMTAAGADEPPAIIVVEGEPGEGLLKPDALEDIWLHVTYEKYEEPIDEEEP